MGLIDERTPHATLLRHGIESRLVSTDGIGPLQPSDQQTLIRSLPKLELQILLPGNKMTDNDFDQLGKT